MCINHKHTQTEFQFKFIVADDPDPARPVGLDWQLDDFPNRRCSGRRRTPRRRRVGLGVVLVLLALT
jgi:hypothetical protein